MEYFQGHIEAQKLMHTVLRSSWEVPALSPHPHPCCQQWVMANCFPNAISGTAIRYALQTRVWNKPWSFSSYTLCKYGLV